MRSREVRGGLGRYVEIQGGLRRYREIWGDMWDVPGDTKDRSGSRDSTETGGSVVVYRHRSDSCTETGPFRVRCGEVFGRST